MPTFDILLLFYDNPEALHNWLARLFLQSDYLQFSHLGEVIVCDTGSPSDRIPANLDVLKRWAPYKRVLYMRADTDSIRAAYAGTNSHVRPTAATFNACTRDVCRSDLVLHSVIGNIFLPEYFRQVLALHQADPRLFVQPKQHRLHSDTYHRLYYDQPIQHALLSGTLSLCNGLPDFSVRREHILAIGGWDEDYITWGMCDIDICSRLCGMIDFPVPAHQWFLERFGTPQAEYANYGLKHCMPYTGELFSLICNDYPAHLPDRDQSRQSGIMDTMPIYLNKWGKIQRNEGRPTIKHRLYEVSK